MNLINIEDLTKICAERKLFDGASFSLQDGEKIGVIGINGTGKTTLAKVIANSTSAEFLQMNATSAGKKDMEDVIAKAKNNMGMFGKRRSCLSTRSIVLIRDSRIIFCRSWKMEPSS